MSQILDEKLNNLSPEELNLYKLRHTAEHVLTQAMINLYGADKVIMAMGPATEDGFYFDFDSPEDFKISEADFKKIEKEMWKIINANLPLTREEVSVAEAKKLFTDNPYKQEWLNEIESRGETVSIYRTGDQFVDLCSGPHADSTGAIKAFKLLSVAGAYWHGDEKNKMLTRIYGTAFASKEELDDYLKKLEEAKKRDHRKLGADLGLFTFSDLVGKGLPLFTAKGATIWRELERYVVDEEIRSGYQHVRTPNIAKTDLYKTSGHYPYYKDTMYPPMHIDEDELILRPMTCPHHFALFMDQPRSYKELPLRFAEMASLYRYEKSGELTGLIRVRSFTLADSHNFVRESQAASEINFVLDLIERISTVLGLEKGTNYRYRLSLGDRSNKDKYYDAPEKWDQAEAVLKQVLIDRQAPYYEAKDEAAFYGPKIDVQMKNVLGKEDTAFTVQYDFCLPERFHLKYINEKGEEEQPVVIHRSSVGAMERSLGFLIEHCAGAFPVWLAPVQVVVIPIGQDQADYAAKVHQALKDQGVRSELWSEDSMQKRIRTAEKQKVPYMLVLGAKEAGDGSVSVRRRGEQNLGVMSQDDFCQLVHKDVTDKTIW